MHKWLSIFENQPNGEISVNAIVAFTLIINGCQYIHSYLVECIWRKKQEKEKRHEFLSEVANVYLQQVL